MLDIPIENLPKDNGQLSAVQEWVEIIMIAAGAFHFCISMTNLSLADKLPTLRKSIPLHQWDAPIAASFSF
ncbi:hypothetical protein C7B76_25655 [filamentous cyanobacterium CCP2]|nr:hypothetical protein C7B76_25655 [filamentous cyanobacterium CCP2]